MAQQATIYHNPKCSKSRQTLALLEESSADITVVEYLKEPLSTNQLLELVTLLGIEPHSLLRTKENAYKECNLSPGSPSQDILKAMAENPILMERPVVVVGKRAAIGRPPENVKAIL